MEALSKIGEFFFDDGRITEEERLLIYLKYKEELEAKNPKSTSETPSKSASKRKKTLGKKGATASTRAPTSLKHRATTKKEEGIEGMSATGSSTGSRSVSSTASEGIESMIPETVCADLSIRSVSTRSKISESGTETGSSNELRHHDQDQDNDIENDNDNDNYSTSVDSAGSKSVDDDDLSYHSSDDDESDSSESLEVTQREHDKRILRPVKRFRTRTRSRGFWANPFRLGVRSASTATKHSRAEETLVVDRGEPRMVDQLLEDMGIAPAALGGEGDDDSCDSASSNSHSNTSESSSVDSNSHSYTATSATATATAVASKSQAAFNTKSIGGNGMMRSSSKSSVRAIVTPATSHGGFETGISNATSGGTLSRSSSKSSVRATVTQATSQGGIETGISYATSGGALSRSSSKSSARAIVTQATSQGGFETGISYATSGGAFSVKSSRTSGSAVTKETTKSRAIHGWVETADTRDRGAAGEESFGDRIELELATFSDENDKDGEYVNEGNDGTVDRQEEELVNDYQDQDNKAVVKRKSAKSFSPMSGRTGMGTVITADSTAAGTLDAKSKNVLKAIFHKKLGINKPPLAQLPKASAKLHAHSLASRGSSLDKRKCKRTAAILKSATEISKQSGTENKAKEYALYALANSSDSNGIGNGISGQSMAASRIRSLPVGKSSGIAPISPTSASKATDVGPTIASQATDVGPTIASQATDVGGSQAIGHFTTNLVLEGSEPNTSPAESSEKSVAAPAPTSDKEETLQTMASFRNKLEHAVIQDSGLLQTQSIARNDKGSKSIAQSPIACDGPVQIIRQRGSLESITSDSSLQEYVEVAYGEDSMEKLDSLPLDPTESHGGTHHCEDQNPTEIKEGSGEAPGEALDELTENEVQPPRKRKSFFAGRLLQRKKKDKTSVIQDGLSTEIDDDAVDPGVNAADNFEDSKQAKEEHDVLQDCNSRRSTRSNNERKKSNNEQVEDNPTGAETKEMANMVDDSATEDNGFIVTKELAKKVDAPATENGFMAAIQTLQVHGNSSSSDQQQEAPKETELLSPSESKEGRQKNLNENTRNSFKSFLPSKLRRKSTHNRLRDASPEEIVNSGKKWTRPLGLRIKRDNIKTAPPTTSTDEPTGTKGRPPRVPSRISSKPSKSTKPNTITNTVPVDARDSSFPSSRDEAEELRSFSTDSGTEVAFDNPWRTGHPDYEDDCSISIDDDDQAEYTGDANHCQAPSSRQERKKVSSRKPRERNVTKAGHDPGDHDMLPGKISKTVTFEDDGEAEVEAKKPKIGFRKLKASLKGILRWNGKARSAQEPSDPAEDDNEDERGAENDSREMEPITPRDGADATFLMQHQLMQRSRTPQWMQPVHARSDQSTGSEDDDPTYPRSSSHQSSMQQSKLQRVLGRREQKKQTKHKKHFSGDSTTNSIIHRNEPSVRSVDPSIRSLSSSAYSADYTNDESTLCDTTVGETTMQGYSVQNRRVLKTLRLLHAVEKKKQWEQAIPAVSKQTHQSTNHV